jgi:hypothetical protein
MREPGRVLQCCPYRTGSGPVVISEYVAVFEEAC